MGYRVRRRNCHRTLKLVRLKLRTMTKILSVRGRVLTTYSLDVILYKTVGNVLKMTHLLEHVV